MRAEAWAIPGGSDMAHIILLCKRGGRWTASRPTVDGLRNPGSVPIAAAGERLYRRGGAS